MAKDYYQILGLPRNASQEEIKRAYRKLAMQHHPDRAGKSAESRFKEINEAYQVLSNPQKKAAYDQFGEAGVGAGAGPGFGGFHYQSGGFAGTDYDDFFRGSAGFGFGRISDIFEDFFGSAFSQVQSEIQVSLTQALLGATLHLKTQQGEEIELKIPPGTQDGQTFRLRGKGMPHRRGRGDLIIIVRVVIPSRLNRQQRAIVEELQKTGL